MARTKNKTSKRTSKPKGDPLAPLAVISRLEVGPLRLERRRLRAPYTVVRDGETDTIELEYSFEEETLDPGDAHSVNLASMIAAQVALNYGLFCDRIVFHGVYDRRDRQFIRDMAANTGREIYVKKFLQSNPFLQGPASVLPVVRQADYLRAEIVFTEDERLFELENNRATKTDAEPRGAAVLSSGGKESLLSFGLLQEIGGPVHPMFVNESGRHWFTALNAYRAFKERYPETARVWTNADRVFAWMLRHLPFVRPDFARVRSDDYPIRLWTVAVFLFGVLPLVRKRGLGWLVIGSEYDTTRRLSHKGIPHYDGLYDQSRYFDHALTRYFTGKGWGIRQFSVLRPLSELLVLKTLAGRYPDLQQHQVSCHAAHVEGDRVKPCGRCEKCRRVVGMLLALGLDPGRCGYSQPQIDACVVELTQSGVHQEAEGSQHLLYLLSQKGLVSLPGEGKRRTRPHPQIMKLRFDPERSPVDGIPASLRRPLYEILLNYADGAVQKVGRAWAAFDVMNDRRLARTLASTEGRPPAEASAEGNSHIWGELTWPEAEQRLTEVDVALLPVGAIEQHGPHLPLDTDAFDAEYLARKVAEQCSDPKPLVLPLIPYGVSYHHEDFCGTLSLSNETLSKLIYDIGMSAARNGITKLVIVNGHGGNGPTLQFAAQMINRDAHIFTCVDSGETSDADIAHLAETPNDVHAGEVETSTAVAVRPNLVKLQKARKYVPHFSNRYLNFSSKRSVEWYARTAKISPTGVLGDPLKANREKGERIWAVMIQNLVEFVEDLKSMTLEEIYERRY